MLINFIGCGRLGKTLARIIAKNNIATIGNILNKNYQSALAAVTDIGQGNAVREFSKLEPADIYFITTKDDTIQDVAFKLAELDIFDNKTIIAHCSGALSSNILQVMKNKKCEVASIHPLKSFTLDNSLDNLSQVNCSVEGDEFAVTSLKNLFSKLEANVFIIQSENKIKYHIASVMANNYLTTLHYHAMQYYLKCGIEESLAKKITSQLMQDALQNLENNSHQAALTGPIARNDIQTIEKHLAELNNDESYKKLYQSLGESTLEFINIQENSIFTR